MYSWGNWNFSPESEEKINKFCLELETENTHNVWFDLFNYNFSTVVGSSVNEMEVDNLELSLTEENDILTFVKESLEANCIIEETRFVDIPLTSLNKIFLYVKNMLTEESFSSFCKSLASWNNTTLIECSLKTVVLPKLREKQESSACTIYSIKELALRKPDKLCHNVLVPLLNDTSFQFTDNELLTSVFSALHPPQQDLLILSLTKKEDFQENNWLLLHSLTTNLSKNSILEVQTSIQKFSSKFSKSQVFGKFLVHFCKNLNFIENKTLLIEAVEKHETLLKRQALKYLESL